LIAGWLEQFRQGFQFLERQSARKQSTMVQKEYNTIICNINNVEG